MAASCVILLENEAFASAFSQTNMRIDPNNWLKQLVLLNYDLVDTPLLIDLSQKLNCGLID